MKEEIKYDDYTDVGTVFLKGMLDKYLQSWGCKKCGHLGKITIITNVPLDIICDSCEREEKIDNILNK
jgi:hypothetical protein